MIKEDGGNYEIPESDRHSSEYFDEQSGETETQQEIEPSKPISLANSNEGIFAQTYKQPSDTSKNEVQLSESLIEKELNKVTV